MQRLPTPCEAAASLVVEADPRAAGSAELAEHEEALRNAARFICRDAQDRDDLIQDTFERALRYLAAGHSEPVNLRAWLVSILRNAFIDRTRRAKVNFVELENPPAVPPEPEETWSAFSLEQVREALVQLDPDLRAVFQLHYIDHLRYSEVAARLRIPSNTIASRLHRARRQLRERLIGGAE